jgi:proline racemase
MASWTAHRPGQESVLAQRLHFARGELDCGEQITIESILGSLMSVKVVETVPVGPFDAVYPEVSGSAHVTGRSCFWLDPHDALRHGFILR